MNEYAVMLREPDDRVLERLDEKYDEVNVYALNDVTFLVRTKQLAEGVAVAAGIKGKERFATGVVIKLNRSYAGYTSRSLWDWLREDEE